MADMNIAVDILEDSLLEKYPDAFKVLLKDRTTKKNIFWATNDYKDMGEGFQYDDEIKSENITGEHGQVVKPRALKHRDIQAQRSKDMAEVFTPSWVCNTQNNLVDEVWFGRRYVFNREIINEDNTQTWETIDEPVSFENVPNNKSWKDYVRDTRLEITCGEAPYLASRYDTTSGEYIPIKNRIGLLDRKLRIISENCNESGVWLEMAQEAYKNIYGYEWQGDNLLIARESLLCTFIEYYNEKFGKMPWPKSVNAIAEIISWNIWQMDGLKMVIPNSCDHVYEEDVFGKKNKCSCPACEKGTTYGHIGIICMIKNWRRPKETQDIAFSSIVNV